MKSSRVAVANLKNFIVRENPFGPLLATKGIDPTEFGYYSILRDALKMNLPHDRQILPLVREAKRRLRAGWYDSDAVDCINVSLDLILAAENLNI